MSMYCIKCIREAISRIEQRNAGSAQPPSIDKYSVWTTICNQQANASVAVLNGESICLSHLSEALANA